MHKLKLNSQMFDLSLIVPCQNFNVTKLHFFSKLHVFRAPAICDIAKKYRHGLRQSGKC